MRRYLIIIPFLLAVMLARPFGNVFYGGDDWAYALPVHRMIEAGQFRLSSLASVPAILQILIGYLFCRFFGFSLFILNLSTMITACLGIIIFYALIRELGIERKRAMIAAMFMSTSPLYIGFAGSFMSDMSYTVLMITACFMYVRGLHRQNIGIIFLGSIFSTLSFLSRQIGFTLFVAFFCTVGIILYQKKINIKGAAQLLFSGMSVPVLVFLLYFVNPEFFGGKTVLHYQDSGLNILNSALNLRQDLGRLIRSCYYIVIFLLPLLIVLIWGIKAKLLEIIKFKFKLVIFTTILFLGGIFFIIIAKSPLVVVGDLVHFGYICTDLMAHKDNFLVWHGLVFFSAIPVGIFTGLILYRLKEVNFRRISEIKINPGWIFLIAVTIIQFGLICIHPALCNNYFLPFLPLFAALFTKVATLNSTKTQPVFTILVLASSIVVSGIAIGSHNRYSEASWREADRLVNSGIDKHKIYALPSWYAWNNYDFFEKKTESIFVFIKNNSSYLISELPADELSSNFYHLKKLSTVYYDTFLAKRPLYVYSYSNSRYYRSILGGARD